MAGHQLFASSLLFDNAKLPWERLVPGYTGPSRVHEFQSLPISSDRSHLDVTSFCPGWGWPSTPAIPLGGRDLKWLRVGGPGIHILCHLSCRVISGNLISFPVPRFPCV